MSMVRFKLNFHVKYRLNVIFKFLFSPVSIIPPMLHTCLHPNTVITRRTRWWSLGSYKWSSVLSVVGEYQTEKYFHVSDSKVIMQFYDMQYYGSYLVYGPMYFTIFGLTFRGGMWKLLIRSWFLWCLKPHIH
jgi:hypothetical protein